MVGLELNTVGRPKTRKAKHNSRFAKAGVSCSYESVVLNSRFVHLMKFCALISTTSPSTKKNDKFQEITDDDDAVIAAEV